MLLSLETAMRHARQAVEHIVKQPVDRAIGEARDVPPEQGAQRRLLPALGPGWPGANTFDISR